MAEHLAAGALHRPAQQLVMAVQVVGHGGLVAFPAAGAGLDVGEEEGHGVGGLPPRLAGRSDVAAGSGARGPVELGALLQDLLLEPPQAGVGSRPSSSPSIRPELLIGPQRLGLPAEAVEGQHALAPGPLPQRVGRHVRFQAGQGLRRAGRGPVPPRPDPRGRQAGLVEPAGRGGRTAVGQVDQGRTPPQLEGLLAGRWRRRRPPSARASRPRPASARTGWRRPGPDRPPGRSRPPGPGARTGASSPSGGARAQPGDEALDGRDGAGRRPVAPQLLDEHIERDGPVQIHDQQGQQPPLLGAADLEHPPARTSPRRRPAAGTRSGPPEHSRPWCAPVSRLPGAGYLGWAARGIRSRGASAAHAGRRSLSPMERMNLTLLAEARSAIHRMAARTADLLRSFPDLDGPIPGSEWTVRQAAVHLITGATLVGDIATGMPSPVPGLDPDDSPPRTPSGSPTSPSPNPETLAGLLGRGGPAPPRGRPWAAPAAEMVLWHGGRRIELTHLMCIGLGELVLHGHDMATAAGRTWTIEPDHARLVACGYAAVDEGEFRLEYVERGGRHGPGSDPRSGAHPGRVPGAGGADFAGRAAEHDRDAPRRSRTTPPCATPVSTAWSSPRSTAAGAAGSPAT